MSIGEVYCIRKGNECDAEWQLDFTSLSEEDGAVYYSPKFTFERESWYMVMYPNGRMISHSSGYIDLRLWRSSSIGPTINVVLSFAFKTLNSRKEFKRQATGIFKGFSCHRIERFVCRSDFERRRSEFLSSGMLTVVCTLKRLDSAESTNCSYCKNIFDTREISSHEKKCRVKCPECLDVLLLQNWDEHECQTSRTKECSYCKKTVDVENISTHEKKCMNRPIKCPECSEITLLLEWHDHECQVAGAEGGNDKLGLSEVRHQDKILQDLKQALHEKENCDVVLRVKGREFQAHKVILAARSPVFACTFRNDMKEKETGIVEIEDCDPSVFTEFLCFLYSDDVDNLSKENVFGLFIAADKYDVPDLRKMCLEFMKEHLSVETFCETLTLALQHSETELIHLATDFFLKNAGKILVTVKWQSFVAENPTEGNELFIKYVAKDSVSKS